MPKTSSRTTQETITDAVGSNVRALEAEAGPAGKVLIAVLDRATKIQTSAIRGYVDKLRKANKDKSPAQIQQLIDKHFIALITSSGAGAGAAAAWPGVGFFLGMGAVAGESTLFLEAAAFYVLASAYLRGVDIHIADTRKSLILVALLGSSGTALVNAALGDVTDPEGKRAVTTAQKLSQATMPRLRNVSNALLQRAGKELRKRARGAVIGKLLPLGIGVVVGSVANRRLGKKLIENTRTSLGPLPISWDTVIEHNKESHQVAE